MRTHQEEGILFAAILASFFDLIEEASSAGAGQCTDHVAFAWLHRKTYLVSFGSKPLKLHPHLLTPARIERASVHIDTHFGQCVDPGRRGIGKIAGESDQRTEILRI